MMMRIYFATSISGGRDNLHFARQLCDMLHQYGEVLTGHIVRDDVLSWETAWKQEQVQKGLNTSVFHRDMEWLSSADVLVAEVSQPSIGVGREIEYALNVRKIPVLAAYHPHFRSKLIREDSNPLLTQVEYDTIADVASAVEKFFYFPGNGRIFTIDGGDGSGKKTQAQLLVERLKKEGYPVATLDFPHDDALHGDLIRSVLRGEKGSISEVDPLFFASLYAMNRHDTNGVLQYWLKKGHNVILDRYVEANFGHQVSKLPVDERHGMIKKLQAFEHGWLGLPKSHKVLYLDLPLDVAEEAMRNDAKRVMDMHETAKKEYKEAVRQTFLWCAKELPNWTVIDCVENGARISREGIAERMYRELMPDFVNRGDEKLLF
jgi:dTMP kinase